MAVGATHRPPDYEGLAEFVAALAYPLRLELLDMLRFPHTLGEIRIAPRRPEGGVVSERPAARQTIQSHLNQLVEAGLVQVDEVEQNGRMVPRYVVNAPRLYELTEELRGLSRRYAGRGGGDQTQTISGGPEVDEVEGPRLVLVHGVYEGKTFALRPETAQDDRWVVGRRAGASVRLDYDPYVSQENAAITSYGGVFTLTDLGAKNGTLVNWQPLARGGSRRLRTGDVVGVGRSLLSFIA